jgi:hypothetical protein
VQGKIRRAQIPGEEEPVLFGVHSEVAEHYGVSPARRSRTPQPSTIWSRRLADDCSALLPARWRRVKSPSTKVASTPTP